MTKPENIVGLSYSVDGYLCVVSENGQRPATDSEIQTMIKSLTPPPVDGELAKALLWLENTKRHLDEQDRMKEMLYCESLLQAATSQQAREWTVDHETLQNDICSIVSKYGVKDIYSCETEILAAIERAAKNIIKLKRE